MQSVGLWRTNRVGWALALERPTLDEPELRVDGIMSRRVWTCHETDPLNVAAQIMWDHDCGCVPVIDSAGKPIAMLTDRDICMAAFTQGKSLSDIAVASACSRQLVTCQSTAPIAEAVDAMARAQVRRLAVVDAEGRLVGVLAVSDLVRHVWFVRSRAANADAARHMEALLEAVSRPRHATSNTLARMTPQERESLASFDAP